MKYPCFRGLDQKFNRGFHLHLCYKIEGHGCGLCQVGVPGESGIRVKAAREALEKGELPPPPPFLA